MKQKTKNALATAGMLAMMVLWLAIVTVIWNEQKLHSMTFNQILYLRDFKATMHRNWGTICAYILSAGMPMLAYWLIVLLPELLRSCLPKYKVWNQGYRILVIVLLAVDMLQELSCIGGLSVLGVSKLLQEKLVLWQIHLVPVMFFLSLATWLVTQAVRLVRQETRLMVEDMGRGAAGYGLLTAAVVVSAIGSLLMLNVLREFEPGVVGKVVYANQNRNRYMAAIFSSVVCAPIMEEIAFRGVIGHVLDKRMPRWWGLVIGAVLFGLWHRNLGQFVYTFVMALYYGYVYVATGKLRYSIFCHFVNNLLVILAYSRSEQDYFGPQPLLNGILDFLFDLPALVSAVLLAASVAATAWLLRHFAQRHGKGRKT